MEEKTEFLSFLFNEHQGLDDCISKGDLVTDYLKSILIATHPF